MQHEIDLLPESIRARGQAGVRTGRYIGAVVISCALLIVAGTHARISLGRARSDLERATDQADLVLATQARAESQHRLIEDLRDHVTRYELLAHPLPVSSVVATVVNAMPEGMVLDRLELDAGRQQVFRSARDRGDRETDAPPRVLRAELAGFAPDDRTIATYVGTLRDVSPFGGVSLDFSRMRVVRDRAAREFRMSFRIDLERAYDITGDITGATAVDLVETAEGEGAP